MSQKRKYQNNSEDIKTIKIRKLDNQDVTNMENPQINNNFDIKTKTTFKICSPTVKKFLNDSKIYELKEDETIYCNVCNKSFKCKIIKGMGPIESHNKSKSHLKNLYAKSKKKRE